MKTFKIRASQSSKIMTNPRSKSETLSATTKTYCQDWLKEQLYNRRKEFSSKYTEKGLIMEDNSIDFAMSHLDLGFAVKNEKYFENDFMTGTPDVILEDCIIDIKNSWSWDTFPLFDTYNKDYFYQAQCYMKLVGLDKFKLIYTLMDTPEYLVKKETYYFLNSRGEFNQEDFEQAFLDIQKKMTYTDIEDKFKIKVFEIERDDNVIKEIEERVLLCREYINELIKTI